MIRLIRVESCAECPYLRAEGMRVVLRWYCASPVVKGPTLWNMETIPDWCPLEVEKKGD